MPQLTRACADPREGLSKTLKRPRAGHALANPSPTEADSLVVLPAPTHPPAALQPAAHTQKPIYKVRAEEVGEHLTYYGILHGGGGGWETLEESWVQENFSQYDVWLQQVQRGGKALVVPQGACAGPPGADAGCLHESAEGCDLVGALVPSVIGQGDRPFCVAYGLASALAHCGFPSHAAFLLGCAQDLCECTTSAAAEAIRRLIKHGGWAESRVLKNFNPLADRSPHPTILQLCDSDEENTHVVAIAGDWLFDSNYTHALPFPADDAKRSRESLDIACLGAATFARASYAARLVPGKKLARQTP